MTTEHEEFLNRLAGRRISRRDLLQIASKLGLSAAAIGPLLTACGGAATPAPTATETQAATATPTATPTPGTEATATATPTASPTAEAAEEPLSEREKTLIVSFQREGVTIDPAVNWQNEVSTVILGMYEKMLTTIWHEEDDTVELVPQLAESWDISPDNKEFTFQLRKGVTFHDGEPYNAEAQKFAFERHMEINEGPAYMLTDYVDTMEVIDEFTFKLTLKAPVATYLQFVAGYWGPSAAVSPKAVKEHATTDDPWAREWFRGNGVGTGPYKLDEWVPNQQWVLSKFDNYWGGWEGKHMDKLVYRIIPEISTQRLQLERGDIDIVMGPLPPEDFKALEGKPGVVRKETRSSFISLIHLHTQKEPTNNIDVRRGLIAAFDYNAAIENIYGGLALRIGSIVPRGWEGYRGDVELPEKDLEKAKQYLADAGFAGGLDLELIYLEGDEGARRIAEMYQADLASIGVTLSVRPVSASAQWDMESSPETGAHLAMITWSPDNRDSFSLASVMWYSKYPPGGVNWSFYNNTKVDEILDEVQAEADPTKRRAMYEQIDQIVREDAAWLPIAQLVDASAYRDSLVGVAPSPTRLYSVIVYDIYRS